MSKLKFDGGGTAAGPIFIASNLEPTTTRTVTLRLPKSLRIGQAICKALENIDRWHDKREWVVIDTGDLIDMIPDAELIDALQELEREKRKGMSR
jgi:hypothetical protein